MYKIITMEREFGSGGNEIGRRVAKKLGIELYDRNILVEAAKRLDIPPIYIGDLRRLHREALFSISPRLRSAARRRAAIFR